MDNNRILIVDDNPSIHVDFHKILVPAPPPASLIDLEESLFGKEKASKLSRGLTYELDVAANATQGLYLFTEALGRNQPYSVVFADVRLPPGMDGVDMIEAMWSLAAQTQVVIMTAFSDYTWEDLIERFGWSDRLIILRKPFDAITVKQLALMLSRRWVAEHVLLAQREDQTILTQEKARLQQRLADLRQVFDQASDGFLLIGEQSLQILDFNRATLAQVGCSGVEMVTRTLAQLVPEAELERWQQEGVFSSRLCRADGSMLAVEVSLARTLVGEQSCLFAILRGPHGPA